MVNVIEQIKEFLVFDSKDDFYYLQILQRKKENPELGSNSRIIKNYYITSVEYLEGKYDEIIKLCEVFNARAALRLNKRSFKQVGFKSLENIVQTLGHEEYIHMKNSYDRACGLLNNEKNKKWIIDVDENELVWVEEIIASIQLSAPQGDKIITQLQTKSGIHIITKPFYVNEFREFLDEKLKPYQISDINIDIHKDNPINLYIP